MNKQTKSARAARNHLRNRIINALKTHGPMFSQEIADRLECSIQTSNSNLKELYRLGNVYVQSKKYRTNTKNKVSVWYIKTKFTIEAAPLPKIKRRISVNEPNHGLDESDLDWHNTYSIPRKERALIKRPP